MENTANTNTAAKTAIPTDLTPQQALSILVQGVQFAQNKGVYSLDDAELLAKAVRVFAVKDEKKETAAPLTSATEVPVGETTPAN